MERWLPIVILGLGFLGLLGVRVAFLLILRRGETHRAAAPDRRWPEATVIRTRTEES
jgi:hypothetical protein